MEEAVYAQLSYVESILMIWDSNRPKNSHEWLEYLDSKQTFEEKLNILELASNYCPSIDVWCEYAEVLRLSNFDHKSLIALLDRGYSAVKLWLGESQRYWLLYLDFMKKYEPEQITTFIIERLSIPHLQISETWQLLHEQMDSEHTDDGSAREVMAQANKVYSRTKSLLGPRSKWEKNVPSKPLSLRLEYLKKYLHWELDNYQKNSLFDFCKPLFERIVTLSAREEGIWQEYILHLWVGNIKLKQVSNLATITNEDLTFLSQRAVTACSNSSCLWSLRLRILQHQRSDEGIIQTGQSLSNLNMLHGGLKIEYYCALKSVVSSSGLELHVFNELLETEFSNFESSIVLVSLLNVYSSVNDVQRARTKWKTVINEHSPDVLLWKAWIAFEEKYGDEFSLESLFRHYRAKCIASKVNFHSEISQYIVMFYLSRGLSAAATKWQYELCRSENKTCDSYVCHATPRTDDEPSGEDPLDLLVLPYNELSKILEGSSYKCSITPNGVVLKFNDLEARHRAVNILTSRKIILSSTDSRIVLAKSIPSSWNDSTIKKFFATAGTVVAIQDSLTTEGPESRGTAVEFRSAAEAARAIERLNGKKGIIVCGMPNSETIVSSDTTASASRVYTKGWPYTMTEKEIEEKVRSYCAAQNFVHTRRGVCTFEVSTKSDAKRAVRQLAGLTVFERRIFANLETRKKRRIGDAGAAVVNVHNVHGTKEAFLELASSFGTVQDLGLENNTAHIVYASQQDAAKASLGLQSFTFQGHILNIDEKVTGSMRPRILL